MKKWKIDNLFFDTINNFVNGREIAPDRRVYRCIDIQENPAWRSSKLIYLQDVDDGHIIKIPDDDRYGYFPQVDEAKLQNILDRIKEAESNLATLKYLAETMAKNIKVKKKKVS